ncbi:SUMF1/EgtB/PvdO family nonheme iron enzyme [Paenibacillus sp. LHD-117]|uniref:formylglycine-generating enzyme family protein n=1 Tax=Paenibacillus sp. LHD-117 TaxID=3071412 RepID=UPI0027E10135|nr:SUMF1/EgtB/PvdO family nonheme iron enzyme [Paenibacillus sp. LHD-117]MDQ6419579.1 SUMF1/EgtB/PvdO family nonheme iron enzyme [Paenibacillus sp. LHD-117]
MRKPLRFLAIALLLVAGACSQDQSLPRERAKAPEASEAPKATQAIAVPEANDALVFVEGGTMRNEKSNYDGKAVTIPDFYIGKYEVTQQEWTAIMGGNPSAFPGDRLPVEMVSWYDAVEYCNQRSLKEGLEPYYHIYKTKIDKANTSEFDPVKWTVEMNEGANGYRLPTEAEWEYAAGGGRMSESYTFSGSNEADEVAWYWRNAGNEYLSGDWTWASIESNKNTTKQVGLRKPNELGLYDMSGNVREWCWDRYGEGDLSLVHEGAYRVVKGGGWIGDVGNSHISFRGKFEASGYGPDQGFRVVRQG